MFVRQDLLTTAYILLIHIIYNKKLRLEISNGWGRYRYSFNKRRREREN